MIQVVQDFKLENVLNVHLGFILIGIINVRWFHPLVVTLILQLKYAKDVIQDILWIKIKIVFKTLKLHLSILDVLVSRMENVLNAHLDTTLEKKVDARLFLQLVVDLILVDKFAKPATLGSFWKMAAVSSRLAQLVIPDVTLSRMVNVWNVLLDTTSIGTEYANLYHPHAKNTTLWNKFVKFAILDIPLTRTSNAYKVWQHQLTPAARNSRMEFVQNVLLVIISIELRSVNLFHQLVVTLMQQIKDVKAAMMDMSWISVKIVWKVLKPLVT